MSYNFSHVADNNEISHQINNCIDQNNLSRAIEIIDQRIFDDPSNVENWITKIGIYGAFDKTAELFQCLEEGINRFPDKFNEESIISLAQYKMAVRDKSQAIYYAEVAAKQSGNKVSIFEKLADYYRQVGDIDKTIRTMKYLIELDPALGVINNDIHVNYQLPNRIGWLEKQSDELNELIDDFLLKVKFSQSLFQREKLDNAIVQCRASRPHIAEKLLNEYILENPTTSEAFYILGIVQFILANVTGVNDYYINAIHSLEKYLSYKPDDAEALHRLGKVIIGLNGYDPKYTDSIIQLNQMVIDIEPEHVGAHQEIGEVLQSQGKIKESYRYLSKFRQLQDEAIKKHPLASSGVRFVGEYNTYAMGHLCCHLESLVKMKQLGWVEDHNTILLAPKWMVANQRMLDYWSRYFTVISDHENVRKLRPIARKLEAELAFPLLPNGQAFNAIQGMSLIQEEWENRGLKPIMDLLPEDEKKGREVLNKWGLPTDAWFVALHVRGIGFKKEAGCDYNAHRNADIKSYIPAIKLIRSLGGFVIRMGESSMEPLPKMDGVIDYALGADKSDWMDIYLCARARFFLGATSGVLACAQLFGTPIVGTNYSLTPLQFSSSDIYIPKRFRRVSDGTLLNFSELFSTPLFHNQYGKTIKALGIGVENNTEDEITAVTLEMINRLDGKLVYTDTEEALQNRFRKLLSPIYGKFITRIGKDYLNSHINLV